MAKNFRVTERSDLRTEINFFNIFNHTNFGQPNGDYANVANGTFGQISGIRSFTNSRLIQLGAKFVF